MDIIRTYIALGILFLLIFSVGMAISYPHFEEFSTPDNPSIVYSYNRFPEIEKHCGFLISSASELQPDDNRGERMKKELFFLNGDWDQEPGGAPLMPFDRREMPSNTFGYGPPLKLVSFWLMDVDPIRRAKNTVSVSGAMEIGIVRTGSFSYKPYDWNPKFYMNQGTTKLEIIFEGIYVESDENGGLRSMCLLGNATIAASGQQLNPCQPGDPWNPCQLQVNNQPSTLQDDQIMFVLRYPKTLTLRSRGISGEMKSLNNKRSPTYFDRVHISSQLGGNSKYQFGSDELVSKACSPYPYEDNLVNKENEMFKGDDYCEKLRTFVWNEVFEFVSIWKSIGKDKNQYKLGPFLLHRGLEEVTDNNFDKLWLMIQELECEPETDQDGIDVAKVSAVFRVIQQSDYIYREEIRTGVSSLTLSAEGFWRSSEGQLCMVGCLRPPHALSDAYESRVTLYFPHTVSINQRSIVLGTISSVSKSESHPPLAFQRVTTPKEFLVGHPWNRQMVWSYNYSRIMQAKEFQERSMPSNLGRLLKKSFFRYPSSKNDDIASFSFLADVLSVEVCAAPQTLADIQAPKTYVEIVILSMGSLFGRFRQQSHQEKLEVHKTFHSALDEIEISGHLSIKGGSYNISFFFEGLFDPAVGQMYLIGCRDVQKFLDFSTNLDGGLDCLTEIKVEYSPKNARWLLNPNIKLSINSKRRKEDQLYLHPISLNTFLLSYGKKFDDAIVRKGFEEVLRILLLVMAILCIRGQIRYAEKQGHPTAYISLVMLGLQGIGLVIPLITGGEVFLRWKEFTLYRNEVKPFQKLQLFQSLEACIKVLLLFAILESTKILRRVWESRKIENNHVKTLNLRTPSDKLVLLFTVLIHMIGVFIFHALRNVYGIPSFVQSENYGFGNGNTKRLLKWWRELENYEGLVQDFFLLPQISGNALWGVQGKPLRKLYYVGFTMIRLVLQAYDYARNPVPYPNHSDLEYQYLGIEFYDKLGNIIISVIVVTLAVTVYLQQKTGNQNRQIKKLEEGENLDLKSDSYQRLLSE